MLQEEVAAIGAHLGMKVVALDPRRLESKGQVERTISYLESSFMALRSYVHAFGLAAERVTDAS